MATINAAFKSADPRGRILSNLSAHSFVLDGIACASVEGFIQGIKFPPDDPRRQQTLALSGIAAWKMRQQAQSEYVWWNGKRIPFNSSEHAAIIRLAIEAKFDQNPDALEALKATEGLTIIHETGSPESSTTSLPAMIYCQTLTEIRQAALSQRYALCQCDGGAYITINGICYDCGKSVE